MTHPKPRHSTEAVVAAKPVINVAALCGSLRKGSYNRGLIRTALEISKESTNGIQMEYIDISPLPMLDADLEVDGKYPPAVDAFRQKILESDSILFASPEYNYSVTAPLKNAIDWGLRSPNVRGDKAAAIISAGGGFWPPAKFDSDGNLIDPASKERIKGVLLALQAFTMRLQENVGKGTICQLELDEAKVKEFKDAIESNYWFNSSWALLASCILIRTVIMASMSSTHIKNIVTKYNKDQIIHVNLTQEGPKPLAAGKILDLTYSIKWIPTNITFAVRFDVYLDYPFFEHQIHWFSVFNSFMMVIFLTGLVSMILMRTLRNDYAKYAREDDDLETLERDVSEESGWKLVHGDVFRPPYSLALLSAVVGTGAQLALLVLLVILLAIVGTLYIGRGAIVTTFILCYAFTSFISGYVSGGMYSRNGGKSWIKSMILTACLFPFMCFGIGFTLNTIAIFYGSLAAIPFGTMVVVFVIWAFISFPLALLGTVVGRSWSGAPNNPCRVKTIPRPIPEKKWYLTPSVVSLMVGLQPFGSIFIDSHPSGITRWTSFS
ncbi:Transmembrane 9 superfamily member 1 [Hibiscus syriacus]|uniref:Transmembrane 9 superfamily member n=1 Tax=Hibiscus syriacus TaxID=106335 RepID=A0A6A3A2Z5_HIBSY|nr:Transmembrane 9 superfamily member 1 [Hibiscus syriacus]